MRLFAGVALKMLHVQFYRNAIPRYLDGMPVPRATRVANKTGSLDAVRNDVATRSRRRRGQVELFQVFTFDNKDQSWGAEQEGELTIAKLARTIVEAWSPEGLAGWPEAPGQEQITGK